MSRIEQALRRAALETSPSAAASHAVASEPVMDVDAPALASEPFPVEVTERPAMRTHAATVTRPAPDRALSSPAAPAAPAAPAQASAPKDGGLFDRIDARLAEKVVADENISPVSREQYRRLAAVLHDAQANQGLRVIMIASAVPGEGKTLTAANLALTLSESYRYRVLLIDADLRKPALHQVFRLETSAGLIEGLEAQTEVKLVVRQVSARLSILPSGRPTSDPMAALTSERMRRLIDEARGAFDFVILDTPPLMLLPDAHLLCSMIDGAVLVIKANSTPHELVKRAADTIGRARVTGVVLNQAAADAQPGWGTNDYSGYYLSDPTHKLRS